MTRKMLLRFIACAIIMIAPVLSSAREETPQDKTIRKIEQPSDFEKQMKQLQQYQQEMEIYNRGFSKKEKGSEVFFAMFVLFPLILGIIAIVITFFVIHARKERRRYGLISEFIEKGQEVPRELLLGKGSEAAISPEQWPAFIRLRDLRRGTWLFCLGLGIGLTLYLLFDFDVAVICLIFLFLSASCFINALFFSGKSDDSR